MNEAIEAMNEGLSWIRQEWMGGEGRWQGELSEVCDATTHYYGLQVRDIRMIAQAIKNGDHLDIEGFEVVGNKITVYQIGHFLSSTMQTKQDTLLTSPQPSEVNMRVLNQQWRKSESIAIRRAERLSRNLEKIMFVIYDNENECYDIIDEEDLNHLSYEFDLDYDLVAEIG